MERKFFKVREVAEIYSISAKKVREYCHAKGQNFAVQVVNGGNLMVNIEKFDRWFSMHHAKGGARGC